MLLIIASALASPPAPLQWRFHRGDGDFAASAFDDASWRLVDAPHDWSSEDLPPRASDEVAPVLSVRAGAWRFSPHEGNASWANASFDDSTWPRVQVPSSWQQASNFTATNATGWYRRRFSATAAQVRNPSVRLALGAVASADVTYVNGVRVGSYGRFYRPGCRDALTFRSYAGRALNDALRAGDDNVVAVQVWSAGGAAVAGGLVDAEAPGDVRSGPFDAGASPGQRQTGYAVGGIGWYRLRFPSPAAPAVAEVYFEGCYEHCQVYLNGAVLERDHPYGYTSFSVALPRALLRPPPPASAARADGDASAGADDINVLAVRVDNSGRNSRWYSGSGLFRPVRLLVHPGPVHILPRHQGGLQVTTPDVALLAGSNGTRAASVSLRVAVTIANNGSAAGAADRATEAGEACRCLAGGCCHVGFRIRGAGLRAPIYRLETIPRTPSAAGGVLTHAFGLSLPNMSTWSPAQPSLYELRACLNASASASGGVACAADDWAAAAADTFGVRTFSLDAKRGLLLNGQPTKLRGGCVHHANGPLGARAIGRAEYRRVALLKASGYNAIRTSHNPVSEAFVPFAREPHACACAPAPARPPLTARPTARARRDRARVRAAGVGVRRARRDLNGGGLRHVALR